MHEVCMADRVFGAQDSDNGRRSLCFMVPLPVLRKASTASLGDFSPFLLIPVVAMLKGGSCSPKSHQLKARRYDVQILDTLA
jgi:hypothetical protein